MEGEPDEILVETSEAPTIEETVEMPGGPGGAGPGTGAEGPEESTEPEEPEEPEESTGSGPEEPEEPKESTGSGPEGPETGNPGDAPGSGPGNAGNIIGPETEEPDSAPDTDTDTEEPDSIPDSGQGEPDSAPDTDTDTEEPDSAPDSGAGEPAGVSGSESGTGGNAMGGGTGTPEAVSQGQEPRTGNRLSYSVASKNEADRTDGASPDMDRDEETDLKGRKEKISLGLGFSDCFALPEEGLTGSIRDASAESQGTWKLKKDGDGVFLDAVIRVPADRPDGAWGVISFTLLKNYKGESKAMLFFNEETGLVDLDVPDSMDVMSLMEDMSMFSTASRELPEDDGSRRTEMSFKDHLKEGDEKSGGYISGMYDVLKLAMVTNRGQHQVTMSLDGTLNDSYFLERFENMAYEYLEGKNNGSITDSMDEWFAGQTDEDLKPLQFSAEFKNFSLEEAGGGTGQEKSEEILLGDQHVGNFILKEGTASEDGGEIPVVTLQVNLFKSLYTKIGVTFGVNFDLYYMGEVGEREVPKFQMDGALINWVGNETINLTGEPTADEPYKIKKEIESNSQYDPYVTFVIEADSYESGDPEENRTLAGVTLEDVLPDTLDFENMSVDYGDGKGAVEISPGSGLIVNGKKLSYTFPEEITAHHAEVRVKTILSAESFLSKGRTLFVNKASLKGADPDEAPLAESIAEGFKDFAMFKKDGVRDETNGRRFNWIIDIDVAFKGSHLVYLVDSLDPASHEYDMTVPVTVEVGTVEESGSFQPESASQVQWSDAGQRSEPNCGYNSVSAEQLKTITDGKPLARYGVNGNEDVMALKLDDYLNATGADGKHIRIRYSTRITGDVGGNTAVEFNNYADLRWKELWFRGIGPVDYEFQYRVEKPVTAVHTAATKAARTPGGYNESSQCQIWDLDVNYSGGSYSDLVITEDFTESGTQRFPGTAEDGFLCKISEVRNGTTFKTGEIPAKTADSAAPYYELTDDNAKMTIHLGQVNADDYFVVSLATRITGGGFAAQNSAKEVSIDNTAVLTDGTAEDRRWEAPAAAKIPNVLIKKEALKYDPSSRELDWKVTLNPNALKIRNGVMTDVLPEGNEFVSLTKAVWGGEDVPLPEGGVTGGSGGAGESGVSGESGGAGRSGPDSFTMNGQTVTLKKTVAASYNLDSEPGNNESITLTFAQGEGSEIDKTVVLYLTTKLADGHINNIYTEDTAEYGLLKNGSFVNDYINEAVLKGQIIDKYEAALAPVEIKDARANAKLHVNIPILVKEGRYKGTDPANPVPGVVEWTAVINEAGGPLNGYIMSDTIDKNFQEYRAGTMKLARIDHMVTDDSGGVSYVVSDSDVWTDQEGVLKRQGAGGVTGEDAGGEWAGASISEDAFSIPFTGDDKNAYLLTFQTVIIADARPADIHNSLGLGSEEKELIRSNEASGGLDKNFSVGQYVTGNEIPILVIEKKSSSKSASGEQLIKLEGGEFTAYKQKWNDADDKWEEDGAEPYKVKVTDKNGKRLIVNLTEGTMFKIVETKAPAGYQKNDQPEYVYFEKTGDGATPLEEEKKTPAAFGETGGGTDADGGSYKNLHISSGKYQKLTITDDPLENTAMGEISFTKKNSQGTALSGMKFELSRDDGKVAARYAVSGEDGKVSFTHVDPGTYTLKEVENDGADGSEKDDVYAILKESFKLDVSAVTGEGAEGEASYTLTGSDSSSALSAEGDSGDGRHHYVITNQLAQADLVITKRDSVTKAPVSGVTYTLKGMDYDGNVLGGSADGIAYKTDEKGVITFAGIPVSSSEGYTLTETYPAGYQELSEVTEASYQVKVTVNSDQPHKAAVEIIKSDPPANAPDPAPTLGPDQGIQPAPGGAARVTFENTPITGSISFIKQSVDRSGSKTPLKGAKFGLFSSNTGAAEEKDIVKNSSGEPAAAVSGENGKVTFEGIYCGRTYYIRELETVTGYLLSANSVTVTSRDMTGESGGNITADADGKNSFRYEAADVKEAELDNHVAMADLVLNKKDQNGQALENVAFTVSRWGADTDVDAGGAHEYVPYDIGGAAGNSNQSVTDNKGAAKLGSLMFGTYKIEETVPPGLAITPAQPFYLEVGISDNKPSVTRYEKDPKSSAEGQTGTAVSLSLSAEGRWSGEFDVFNDLKYGLLQVNKVQASSEEGAVTIARDEAGNALPLASAVFEVYTEADVIRADVTRADVTRAGVTRSGVKAPDSPWKLKEGAKPFLSLATNGEGHFDIDGNGAYTDCVTGEKKKLILGTYYVRESAAPAGFMADHMIYEAELIMHEGDSYEGDVKLELHYIGNIDEGGTPYFANEIGRGTAALKKADSADESKVLHGAVFVVYKAGTGDEGDKAVASMKETENSGTYVLSNLIPEGQPGHNGGSGIYQEVSGNGISYLKEEEGIFRLLTGDYILKEVKPPVGYREDRENGELRSHEFAITADQETKITTAGKEYFANEQGTQELTLLKEFTAARNADTVRGRADESQRNPAGFTFNLKGTPDGAGMAEVDESRTTGADGKASFGAIPYGTYTLTETGVSGAHQSGDYILMEPKTVVVSGSGITMDGTGAAEAGEAGAGAARSGEAEAGAARKGIFTVENTLKAGSISGSKTGSAGSETIKLAGAEFGLYRDRECSQPVRDGENPVTAYSGQEGAFVFQDLPYNTYYVKEINAPEGYRVSKEVYEIMLTGDEDGAEAELSAAADNELLRSQVELAKTDGNGPSAPDASSPVPGAVFGIYRKADGAVSGNRVAFLTDPDGDGTYTLSSTDGTDTAAPARGHDGLPVLVWEDGKFYLTYGEYEAVEEKAPDYFEKDPTPVPFTINGTEEVVKLSKTNTRVWSFMKMQKDTDHGVEGASFTIYSDQACTNKVMEAANDNPDGAVYGIVTVRRLSAGTYYMKETGTPAGYENHSDTVYKLYIADNTADVVMTLQSGGSEQPAETVTVDNRVYARVDNTPTQKVDVELVLKSTTGEPIKNTQFIYYSGHRPWAVGVTDDSGKIIFKDVPCGDKTVVYSVKQNGTVEGYVQVDMNPVSVTSEDLKAWADSGETGPFPVEVFNKKSEKPGRPNTNGGSGGSGSSSSGGGHASSAKPVEGGPGAPPEAAQPAPPEAVQPALPEAVQPALPEAPVLDAVTLSAEYISRLELPPGITAVEIYDESGHMVYEGDAADLDGVGLRGGTYRLVSIGNNKIPLGEYVFYIDEYGVLRRGLPKTGDWRRILLPILLLSVLCLSVLLFLSGLFGRKKKKI